MAGIFLGRVRRERDPIIDARFLRRLVRALDRRRVVVEAEELGVRERLRHDDRRRAVAAADVGDLRAAFELLLHSVQRRNPLADQVGAVAGPEEPLGPAEQPVIVLVPAHALAAAKGLENLIFVGVQGRDRVVDAEDVERAVLIGQRERVLIGQRVAVALGVVGHVAAGRLVSKPLAHVALSRARALRHLLRGQRPGVSHRFVQAELLADQHERRADDRPHVGYRLPHKGFELGLVNLCRAHIAPPESQDDRSVWAAGANKQTTAGRGTSLRESPERRMMGG